MDVQFGTLLNVYGSPANCERFSFVPADVQLAGRSFTSDFRLRDHLREHVPIVLRRAVDEGFDAAWVRARLPNVFHFVPASSEVEKSLLDVGFVAVDRNTLVAYPIVCTDQYGRSALMFSDDGPDQGTKQSIADAFWGLLYQNPEDVSDFEERVYHPGAGVWLNYGCEFGRLFRNESDE